jgi:SOS-response transcriptional repressor LexA
MTGLTPKQARTLAFITAFIDEKGWSPSMDEIASGIDAKHRSGAHRMVSGLVARGAITHHPHRRRSIEIVAQARPPEGIDFLPDQLAVWVRVLAARAGVTPLDIVTEAVRDAYSARRKPEQFVSREASGQKQVAA